MIEDFPTPVSPTRRMLYDLFADVLIIPFLRDSTSLEKMIRGVASKKLLYVTYLREISFSASKPFSRGPVEWRLKRTLQLERLIGIHGSARCFIK